MNHSKPEATDTAVYYNYRKTDVATVVRAQCFVQQHGTAAAVY